MTNFRLNLPVDIPWKLIDSSPDMMDGAFCNAQSPNPFRSSLAIFAYEPKAEELPEDLCGQRITYLKVSCTITGYQPTGKEKEQIVRLFEQTEVDYANLEQIVNEYFGCYGVMLNVSVHPFDEALKQDFDQYPRIVDFEPKTRDFYQAASETGEVLTASVGKVTTNKSFGSTDSTQSSWQAGANANVSPEAMLAMTGVPVGIGTNGTTSQVRTDTDQANWSIGTDASRERREGQSTTTQLSQMYNLLTGYHTGSNRAAFVMLPRPHVLQPTDRRTFVQGLRIIEGVQDFFLVVARPAGQDALQVDAHLQTGHFPENIDVPEPSDAEKFDRLDFIIPIDDSVTGAREATIFGDGYVTKPMSKTREVADTASGWEADPTRGDPGSGGVHQILRQSRATIKEINFETGQVTGEHEIDVPSEAGLIEDVEYGVTDGQLVVSATLSASRKNAFGSYGIARFSRLYQVFIRRAKANAPVAHADVQGLLITQRSLCVQIALGECLQKIPLRQPGDPAIIVAEPPVDLGDLADLPLGIDVSGVKGGIHPAGPRFDFAFKKAILRKIQQALVTSSSSPLRYTPGEVGYLQTRHFQRQLLRVLPARVLNTPLGDLDFVDLPVKSQVHLTLGEFLSIQDPQSAARAGLPLRQVIDLKKQLFKSPEDQIQ